MYHKRKKNRAKNIRENAFRLHGESIGGVIGNKDAKKIFNGKESKKTKEFPRRWRKKANRPLMRKEIRGSKPITKIRSKKSNKSKGGKAISNWKEYAKQSSFELPEKVELEKNKVSNLSDLCAEVLICIFLYLEDAVVYLTLPRVCKYFFNIALNNEYLLNTLLPQRSKKRPHPMFDNRYIRLKRGFTKHCLYRLEFKKFAVSRYGFPKFVLAISDIRADRRVQTGYGGSDSGFECFVVPYSTGQSFENFMNRVDSLLGPVYEKSSTGYISPHVPRNPLGMSHVAIIPRCIVESSIYFKRIVRIHHINPEICPHSVVRMETEVVYEVKRTAWFRYENLYCACCSVPLLVRDEVVLAKSKCGYRSKTLNARAKQKLYEVEVRLQKAIEEDKKRILRKRRR